MEQPNRIRVLVADDSAFMRKIISDLLASEADLEVVGTARDGLDALEKVKQLKPDVLTLDVEMPRLDGLGCLQRLMEENPLPVVMLSSLTQAGADTTIKALALGAVDFLPKPSGTISLDMHKVKSELVAKIRLAARARRSVVFRKTQQLLAPLLRERTQTLTGPAAGQLVVIGSSTGGPGALHQLIPRLPSDLGAGVIIVQHMPAGFTASLAKRLDEISAIRVKEAAAHDLIRPGLALVAPGGYHLVVEKGGEVTLNQEPPQHGVRPAVDVTLESAVDVYGAGLIGVILTGMGFDGARGMAKLKKAGGRIIAQDEETCVVYGMPKAVIEMGNADVIAPIEEIADEITRMLKNRVGGAILD